MAEKTTETSYGPIMDYLADASNMVAVGFTVILVAMVVFGWPILRKMLDDRSAKIAKQLEDVAAIKAEAEQMLAQYKEKHANAMAEAEAIVEQAKADAVRMAENAEEELARTLERRKVAMEARIAQMEARAGQELQRKTVDAALSAARSVLADGAAKNAGLIDAAIEDLPKRLN